MKRVFILFIFTLSFITVVWSQLTANGNYHLYNDKTGIDKLFLFNGIDTASEIKYTGTGTTINWYKFTDKVNSISNLTYIYPENNTGYILDVDGVKTTIWVFDYKNYLPIFTSLSPENNPSAQCIDLNLLLIATIPPMTYYSASGIPFTLNRNFKVSYESLEWGEDAWKPKTITFQLQLPATTINVEEAPLCDTYFTISGDQFAEDLEIEPISFKSSFYSAVAVSSHITTTTSIREEKNEADRPSDNSIISGSSPLDLLFKSNANIPIASFYKWEIFKENQLLISRNVDEHRYTFVETGSYKVRLTVSNINCTYTDSVTIKVSNSGIQVPNVFTPNGDKTNDEFRVGHKSLVSFQCWVYNRWGRKVFSWSDPQKGWDGNIGGKPAPSGPYFYVIKAKGADGEEYIKKGDINLLRGKMD